MQTTAMKPMFLPEVERDTQPSPYAEMIRAAQEAGREYSQIWHLFAFRPETTAHLARFTQGIMREPAPISPALRELIATYTSYLNECEFCMKSHAAASAELLGSEELVSSVLKDLEASPLSEKDKALLRFAAKVTKDLASVTAADSRRLNETGWNDEAIYYTLTVCALFNFYNRWITATGVHAMSEEAHRSQGKVLALNGYVRK